GRQVVPAAAVPARDLGGRVRDDRGVLDRRRPLPTARHRDLHKETVAQPFQGCRPEGLRHASVHPSAQRMDPIRSLYFPSGIRYAITGLPWSAFRLTPKVSTI